MSSKLLALLYLIDADDSSTESDDSDDSDADDREDEHDDLLVLIVVNSIAGNRPKDTFDRAPMLQPWNQLQEHVFNDMTGFFPHELFRFCSQLRLDLDPQGLFCGRYGTKCSLPFAIFVVLARLGSTQTWYALAQVVRVQTSWLRSIFTAAISQLIQRYDRVITRIDRFRVLSHLQEFADAVREETGGLHHGVGCFLDGKFISTCRPLTKLWHFYQRSVYNGYYRGHGKRAMHLVFPDGIIVASVGSVRRSDQFLRARDSLEAQMNSLFIPSTAHPNGDPSLPFRCWSDTAYADSGHFCRARSGAGLTAHQIAHDSSMIQSRMSVEYSFCHVVALFPFMDYKKKLRLGSCDVDDLWKVAVLLTNVITCFRQCQTNSMFMVTAPSVEEYLVNANMNWIP